MRKHHHLTTLIAGATAALLLSPLAASPASASNSYNGAAYVNGAGDPIDDLYDEGVLSTTQNTRSNATCMWQKILWAHQLLAWNDIDGVFGEKTRDATIEFQMARKMPPMASSARSPSRPPRTERAEWTSTPQPTRAITSARCEPSLSTETPTTATTSMTGPEPTGPPDTTTSPAPDTFRPNSARERQPEAGAGQKATTEADHANAWARRESCRGPAGVVPRR